MKYDIRVGDYVETKQCNDIPPFYGYVSEISENDEFIRFRMKNTNDNKNIYPFYGKQGDLSKYFNRIGKYEFTKKEKLEPIDKLDIKLKYKEVIADKITTHTDGTLELEHGSKEKIIDGIEDIDNVTLYSKINEIIDRLNSMDK